MKLLLRICVGEYSTFLAQASTLASVIALISGSMALKNALSNVLLAGAGTVRATLAVELLGEVEVALAAWAAAIWVLAAIAAYVVSLHSARDLQPAASILADLGASRAQVSALLRLRLALLALAGWAMGWPLGLVASQVAFRLGAYLSEAPYEVPVLYLADVAIVGLLTFAATFLGGLIAAIGAPRATLVGGGR